MAKRKTILGIPKHGQPTSCAPYAPLDCSALRDRLVGIELRLSIHPAGMDDWNWYEQLCLECADEIAECVRQLDQMQNATVERTTQTEDIR